ncbi:MAG: signal peptide peptidase SppA [Bacteroidales bacterium]|nr:signal peptide peptidase SppA [Bacteroidales bacterium]
MGTFGKTFFAALLGTLAALIINFFLFFILIFGLAAAAGSSSDSVPIVPKNAILKIDLSKPIAERSQDGFSGNFTMSSLLNGMPEPTLGIYDAVRAIEKAADDNSIEMILINCTGELKSSISAMEEIRAALERFHDSGKPIIAYGTNFSQGEYYLGSIADKIYVHTDGTAMMTGIGANMMFYKDLLDMAGVEFQLIRHGKFKAAAEQYIKNDISPENRQQNMEMLSSVWNTWAEAICKNRGIELSQLNEAINELKIGDAASLLKYNLVDDIYTTQDINNKLCELTSIEGAEDLKYVSLANYAKTVSLPMGSKGAKKVAVLYANGEIAQSNAGITATKMVKEINKIKNDKSIDAVVFRVNSPGGDAQVAEFIREALQDLRESKPLVCSYGDYAASGGYWITAQSDRIFSNNTTLTGSIGVFSLAMNYGKGLKKHLKINTAELGTHKHSAMGGVKRLEDDEVAYIQQFIEKVYTKFMDIVADGRKMSVESVDSIAQGRVWTGEQGMANGLVDEIGGIKEAIDYAAQLAGASLKKDGVTLDYKVVEYPRVKSSYESLLESMNGSSDEALALAKRILSEVKELQESTAGGRIKTYARMPYTYHFSY